MLQFYFLSVFLNLFAGFVLVNRKKNIIQLSILEERGFCIVLGVICALTGVIKLFVVVNTSVVIFGDFIPALAGMAGGLMLFIKDDDEKLPEWIRRFFVPNGFIVGIVCLCAALLHFVFPGAMFL